MSSLGSVSLFLASALAGVFLRLVIMRLLGPHATVVRSWTSELIGVACLGVLLGCVAKWGNAGNLAALATGVTTFAVASGTLAFIGAGSLDSSKASSPTFLGVQHFISTLCVGSGLLTGTYLLL